MGQNYDENEARIVLGTRGYLYTANFLDLFSWSRKMTFANPRDRIPPMPRRPDHQPERQTLMTECP